MADNTIANAIKFLKGEEKSLPATKTEGQVYFAYKNVGTAEKPSYTGAIYIDTPIGGTQTRIKMTANADIADKAFNDSAGLNIRETYLSSLGYTDDGKQTILIKGSGNNQTRIALPIASTTKSGIVTTDAQNFGGTKTFTTINSTNLTITGPDGFNYSSIGSGTADAVRPVWFADNSGNGKPVVNTNFTYNPATQTLSVANLSGTADKANKDNAGNDIRSTYIDNITVNGTTLTFTKGSGATSSITLQDTNNAVTQTAIKSSDYTNWRTVLWGASNSGVEGFTPTTVTDSVFTSDTLTFQPSSGTLRAKVFKGSLSGNASTATTASKAINDGSNQNIANTYVKYKSIKFSVAADKVYLLEGNGAGSVTATSGSNISTAIIPAATDKAAGVITATAQTFSGDKTFNNSIIVNDCLVSKTIAGTDKSRFIILPRVPYSMIDSTHDTPTYFKALLKWICANYPNKKDYSFIGIANPNTESNVLIHIYDTGAINAEGYPEYSTGVFKYLGGALCTFGTASYNYYCRDTLMTNDKYAGSASSGGAATSADKLNTDAGSVIQPIYFKDGKPIATTYILNAHVQAFSGDLSTGGWKKMNGNAMGSYITIGYSGKSAIWNSSQYSSSIVFGTFDTKGLLDCSYYTPIVTFGGGSSGGSTDDNPHWYFKLSGTSGQTYTFPATSKTLAANDGSNVSGTWGISITGKSASTDAINWVAGNEIRFTKPNYTSPQALHIGYSWADGTQSALISEYRFENGNGYNLAQITASQFNGNLNGNANTASNLNGINTILSTGVERSAITIKTNDSGIFTLTDNCSLRNAIDFRWYETNWQIGNIRGGSTDSVGFGFAFSSNSGNTFALKSYIDTNGYYHGGVVGNSDTATALTSSAGSSTQPVYFSGGKPVACTYTLGKSVPSNAVFTDTNTWRPLGTTGDTACAGNDSRLSNARPASDVYSWAKASSKPSYSWGEITGKPSTFTPSDHEHTYLAENFSNTMVPTRPSDGRIAFYYNINMGLENNMPCSNNANAILSLSRHAGDYSSQLGFSSDGNVYYRAGDRQTSWKTMLDSSNYTSYTVTKTGSGASGTWGINVSGSAGSVAWGNVTGKPSTFTPSSHEHSYVLDVNDGSHTTFAYSKAGMNYGDYTWLAAWNGNELRAINKSQFATASHTHPYLPLAGGTMTGTINFTTNKLACMFGGSNSSYYSGVMHQNFGNEAIVFAATNSVTSFIFKCGQSPNSMANNTWANITPSMQIKKQSVYINSLIANGVTPGYNLYVNGSTCCHGTLGVGSGSGSAEIDFFPSSSSTIGARIKAYSDRIEFVFS